jgi:polysaccharide pyruvyl transferase WcaK-like protein
MRRLRSNVSCGRPEPVLAGYFGFSNVGDELILRSVRNALGCESVVASGMSRSPLSIFFRLLSRKSSCLVFAGGEIFQDRTGFLSLIYYVLQASAALLARRPLLLLFQGWPADLSAIGRRLVLRVFRSARMVSLRDRNEPPAGLEDRGIRFSGDACFLLDPPRAETAQKDRVLCVLRKPRNRREARDWDAALGVLAEMFKPAELKFCAFHPDDGPFSRRCASVIGVEFFPLTGDFPNSSLSLVAESRFVLCGRYHAAVLSLLCGRRALGLDSDGRIAGLADYTHGLRSVPLREVLADREKFRSEIDRALRGEPPSCSARLRREAESVISAARDILSGGTP